LRGNRPRKLKYYNAEVHRAAFALPEFLKTPPARRRH
jgi:spermidine synthase